MARLDVHRERGTDALLVDCQADLLSFLRSRFVVPLEPEGNATPVAKRLNPVFDVAGSRYVMATHLAAAVPVETLGDKVGMLDDSNFAVTDAIDFLLSGV